MTQQEKRVAWIDDLKGIGILLVVLGHCITYLENSNLLYEFAWRYIASFNMPLFFMISGYLYRKNSQNLIYEFKKKSKRLLVPFFIATIMCVPLGYLRGKMTGAGYNLSNDVTYILSLSTWGNTLNGVTWFLVALLWISIIHSILRKHLKLNEIQCVGVGLLLFIASQIGNWVSYLPFGRWRVILSQYLIYALGNALSHYHFGDKLTAIPSIIVGGIAAIVLNTTVAVSEAHYGNSAVFLFCAVLSCYGCIEAAKWICSYKAISRGLSLIEYIGRNSLIVMCTHIPVMYVVRIILGKKESPILVFIGTMIGCIAILWLNDLRKKKYGGNRNGTKV